MATQEQQRADAIEGVLRAQQSAWFVVDGLSRIPGRVSGVESMIVLDLLNDASRLHASLERLLTAMQADSAEK